MRSSIGLLIVAAISLWSSSASGQPEEEPRNHRQNASFLSRRFLTDTKDAAALTDDFARKAHALYNVRLLIPNGGLLNSTGTLDHDPFAVKIFLDHVDAYEDAKGVRFALSVLDERPDHTHLDGGFRSAMEFRCCSPGSGQRREGSHRTSRVLHADESP